MKKPKLSLTALCALAIFAGAFLVFYLLNDEDAVRTVSNSRSVGNDTDLVEGFNVCGTRNGEPVENDLTDLEKEEELTSGIVRKNIESTASSYKPHWKVTTWFGKPCIGAKVVATEVRRDLVDEWLAAYGRGEEPNPVLHKTETDLDGSFSFFDLEARVYCVRAEAEGYSSAYTLLDLSNGWVSDLKLEVEREKKIKGVMVDCSGKPVSVTIIDCFPFLTGNIDQAPLEEVCNVLIFSQKTITDAKGMFSFRGLSREAYKLYSEPEGYISVEKKIDLYDYGFQRIVLKKPCILEGKVIDGPGNPIEGAKISYRFPQGGLLLAGPFYSDEEGNYRIVDTPEGGIILQASHEDLGNSARRIVVQSGVVNEQIIVLLGGVRIDLTVTDGIGDPLEGADVEIGDWDSGAFLGRWMTDKEGFVKIDGINRGSKVRIRVRKSGHYSKYSALHSFQENGPLRIELRKRFPTHLRVFDSETGDTITGYHVCISPFFTFTGVQEKFDIQRGVLEFDFEKEYYEIYVGEGETFGFVFFAGGYLPAYVTVVPPDQGVTEIRVIDVPIKKGGVLNGIVVDAKNGNPVQDAKIQFYLKGTLNNKPICPLSKARTITTGEDGVFVIEGMAKGRFFFKVQAPGYAPTLVDSCELDSQADAGLNIVKLWPGGVLSGMVLGEVGSPLEEATVQVILPGTDEAIIAKTNPDGTYFLSGLPPGQLEVLVEDFFARVSRGAWMKLRKIVTMPPGGTKTVDFSFAGTCTIHGTCSYDGKPGWGVTLEIIDSGGKTICKAHSSNNGYYRIFGISPGKHIIEAKSTLSGIGGTCRRTLSLSEGEELELDIDLTNKAAYGEVQDVEGLPIHGAIVEFLNPSLKRTHTTFTDQKGNYTILSVEEGTYSIAARADNCAELVLGPWPLGGNHPARKVDFGLGIGGIGRIVVTSREGDPVPEALVHLSADFSKGSLRRGVTRYSGVCVFENLSQDALNVLVGAVGFAPGSARLNAEAGERTTCDVELIQGGDIRLEVKTREGIPVSGALVDVSRFNLFGLVARDLAGLGLLKTSDPRFITDETGIFTLGSLPTGSVSLTVSRGTLFHSTEASIAAGKTNNVRVILE